MEEYNGIPRLSWESDHEWQARVSFLESNKDHFTGDRLASLSMAWSNWTFMGCNYGPEVQEILSDCHSRLPPEVDQNIQKLLDAATPKVRFVKAKSENLGTRTGPPQATGGKRPALDDYRTDEYTTTSKQKTEKEELKPKHIPGLKIYLPSNVTDYDFNVIGSLVESCQKAKKMFEFVEDCTDDTKYKSLFSIDGNFITEGTALNKKDAKKQCAENALKLLRQHHEVIYKDEVNHDTVSQIEKNNLVKDSYAHAPKISEDNLGSKLLKKMGWDGSSGVGKFNHGRSEPVFVDAIENREGIGHKYEDRSIRKSSVEKTLFDFLRDETQNEIKFSKDCSKDDRALVHKLCQKYHLRHKSFGKGEERYLVVSK